LLHKTAAPLFMAYRPIKHGIALPSMQAALPPESIDAYAQICGFSGPFQTYAFQCEPEDKLPKVKDLEPEYGDAGRG
jgi:hypothetical protein